MPLIKRPIEPANLARVGNIPAPIRNELEYVANITLANIIRQLSGLGKQADDMFTELFNESVQIFERTKTLIHRMDTLKVKATQLDSNVEEVSLMDMNLRKPYRSVQSAEQQVIAHSTMPRNLLEMYKSCDAPPRLDKLDPYRADGKSSMKFYTNPNYFFELWLKDLETNAENLQLRRQKGKKRPSKKAKTELRVVQSNQEKYQMLKDGIEFAPPSAGFAGGRANGGGGGTEVVRQSSVRHGLPVPEAYPAVGDGAGTPLPTTTPVYLPPPPELAPGSSAYADPMGGRGDRANAAASSLAAQRGAQYDARGLPLGSAPSPVANRMLQPPPPPPVDFRDKAAAPSALDVPLLAYGSPRAGDYVGAADDLVMLPPPPLSTSTYSTVRAVSPPPPLPASPPTPPLGMPPPPPPPPLGMAALSPPPPPPPLMPSGVGLPYGGGGAPYLPPPAPPPPPPMLPAAGVPPPPPPPPAMPASTNGLIQSSDLAAAASSLKSSADRPKAEPVKDERSVLLQQIRLGIQLRQVEEESKEPIKKASSSNILDVQTIMDRAFEMRRRALEASDSEEEADDGGWGSDDDS